MKNSTYTLTLLLTLFFATSCDKDSDDIQPNTADYSSQINNLAENVILKTYEDLATTGATLQTATQTLENSQTEANLSEAKIAWINARSPWEQSEGFLFGPVDQEGLDPSMDSWPVNVTDLNNVLSSSNDLTIEFLAAQEGTLKGFHTVEFLLWGENGDKQISDFTSREFEYLAAASGALAEDTQSLFDLWKPTGENYVENLISAGNGSAIYVSQKSALEEITNSMVAIADEVANGKINDPLVQQDLTLEESRFSANSKADFADNIRSIKNIYTGYYGANGTGNSLSSIIAIENSGVDSDFLSEIDDAIEAIENIPGTFSEAVINNPSIVADAQEKVRDIQETLEENILPIISGL